MPDNKQQSLSLFAELTHERDHLHSRVHRLFAFMAVRTPNSITCLLGIFSGEDTSGGSAISSAMQSHISGRLQSSVEAPHPYETEIQALQFESFIPQSPVKERIYGAFEETPPHTWVDTVVDLQIMVEKLSREKEIAVDLEEKTRAFLQ